MAAPLFSIVMPTRNRVDLLQHSLMTALEQRLDPSEFEVVVSDNSSDGSAAAFVLGISAPNLRYVSTGSDLAMPDSWEFAVSQARGRFVTFLCDDDALMPSSLSTLGELLQQDPNVELVSWATVPYYYADWPDRWLRNHIVLGSFSGRAIEEVSAHALRRLFAFDWSCQPKMLDSICSQDVLGRIRSRAGRVFLPTSPDYSFAAASLGVTKSFIRVDRPLAIGGVSLKSIGFSSARGGSEATTAFLSEFGVDPQTLHPDVPLAPTSVASGVLQSIINVARSGVLLDPPEPDMRGYYTALYRELKNWAGNGVTIAPIIKAMVSQLTDVPDAWSQDLLKVVQQERLKRTVRHWIGARPWLARSESRVRARLTAGSTATRMLKGAEYGFSNILEAARGFERWDLTAANASVGD